MSQSGYTPILIYASGTATNVPLAANLTSSASGAELALNYADGKLYYKNSSGTVTLLASAAGSLGDVVGPASATDNALARFDLTTGKLIQNSVGILSDTGALSGITDITASGSITLSGGTANGVAYLNGSKVLTTGSALVFDGTNLGVGVTPSAWSWRALQVGSFGGFFATNSAAYASYLGNNAYYDGSNWRYIASTGAVHYELAGGDRAHKWYNAASGTANAAITFTQAMTLDSSGNLGIGTTSPGTRLQVTGANTTFDTAAFGQMLVQSTTAYNSTPRAGIAFSVKYTAGGTYTAGGCTIQSYKENSTDGDFGTGLLFTTQGNAVAPSEKMRLDSSGNLGIGTTSPTQKLTVNSIATIKDTSNSVAQLTFAGSGSDFFGRIFYNLSTNAMQFFVNSAEAARIDSSGNLLVGGTGLEAAERLNVRRGSITTSALTVNVVNSAAISTSKAASALLRIASNASGADSSIQLTDSVANNYYFGGNNGGAYVMANSNGVRLSNGGTSWASDSDERVKDIIEPIIDAANKVLTLRAVIGKYKTDEEGTRRSFLIAQDVQAVLPEAVFDEQGTLMLAYTETIPLLVAAIKEQQALITQLTARITALEGA